MNKKYKSKQDKKEKKKKELNQDLEYLRQVDVPDAQGGGRKFVIDKIEEEKKEQKKITDAVKNVLDPDAMFSYRRRLAEYGFTRLEEIDFPEGWLYFTHPTDGSDINIYGRKFKTQEGVLMIVKSKKGNVYMRAILVTGDPEYDVNAMNILVIQAENVVDSEKGILLSDNKDTASTLKRTDSGIYVKD